MRHCSFFLYFFHLQKKPQGINQMSQRRKSLSPEQPSRPKNNTTFACASAPTSPKNVPQLHMEKVSSSDEETSQSILQEEDLNYTIATTTPCSGKHVKQANMDNDKEKKKLKSKSVLTSDEEIASKKHKSFLGRLFGFKSASHTPPSRNSSPQSTPKDVSFVVTDDNVPQLSRSVSTPEGKRAPQRKRASAKLFEEVVVQQEVLYEDDSAQISPGTPKSPSSPSMSTSPPATPARGRGRTVSKRPAQTLEMFLDGVVDHGAQVSQDVQSNIQVQLQQRLRSVDPSSVIRVDNKGWVYFQNNDSNIPKMMCIFYSISMKALQEALDKHPEKKRLVSAVGELTCTNVIHLKKKDNGTELVCASSEFVDFFISSHAT